MDTSPLKKDLSVKLPIRNLWRSSIHFAYLKLIKPLSDDEDVARREFILNIILSSSIVLITLLDLSVLYGSLKYGSAYQGISLIAFSTLVVFFIALLVLSRRGHHLTASYLLILAYFIGASYSSYKWGVSLPAALLSYGLIITISSVLISSRFGFMVTLIIFLSLSFIGDHEMKLGILPDWKKEAVRFDDIISYSFILLLITVISWLSNRETEKSLVRARRSEKALEEKNRSLEIIVEERTRELRQAQMEKLSQLYRFVEFGRLSSGIFHDILNPLSILTSNMEFLASSFHPNIPEIKEHLSQAILASKRMERFIDTVRKQFQSQDSRSSFSANREIEEVLMLFDYKAKKHRVLVDFMALEEIHLEGNPIKFHQIITNLVSNAFDSYEKKPLKKEEERIISIFLKKESDHVQIEVKDHGSGIDKETIRKIFDPFFTTKEEHKGIGLGLSTTKSIVESDFKGSIKVESESGKGTIFIIELPQNIGNEQK